jgi:16S rRNA (uracil1498-N3)-methyltransferase
MNRSFVDKTNINLKEMVATVDDKGDCKHIVKVLRLKEGDQIEISDKEGSEYIGEISSTNDIVELINLEKVDVSRESNLKITLFQGIPKSDKMDLIVQKNVELGIFEIIPVQMKRSVSKIDRKKVKSKLERWEKIAWEAAKQSKRSILPRVDRILDFKAILELVKDYDMFLVAYENEKQLLMKELKENEMKNVAILIGPEGGIADEEIDLLIESGAKIVSLGKRILRTETAGFTLNTILQYEFGDMG